MKIKIVRECSDFLKAADGLPLIKMLPTEGSAERRVRVRKKKSTTPFDEAFNNVFIDHPDVRQRCILTNGSHALKRDDTTLEAFYIFPLNGFKFLYSTRVSNSSEEYGAAFNNLCESMDEDQAKKIIGEVISYDYKSDDLFTGLLSGCEIILFGIPAYYAISANSVKSYSTLFSL